MLGAVKSAGPCITPKQQAGAAQVWGLQVTMGGCFVHVMLEALGDPSSLSSSKNLISR